MLQKENWALEILSNVPKVLQGVSDQAGTQTQSFIVEAEAKGDFALLSCRPFPHFGMG